MEKIYATAMGLLNNRSINDGKAQKRFFFDGEQIIPETNRIKQQKEDIFEFVVIHPIDCPDQGAEGIKSKVKIMKKLIGFSFTISKNDPEDIRRMEYVYDIAVACNNDQLLLPLSKKVIPKWEKVNIKFPGKITRKEYMSVDIHDKDAVVSIINKIRS